MQRIDCLILAIYIIFRNLFWSLLVVYEETVWIVNRNATLMPLKRKPFYIGFIESQCFKPSGKILSWTKNMKFTFQKFAYLCSGF
jgi:hypothetical protein